jgi:hypothetical protein
LYEKKALFATVDHGLTEIPTRSRTSAALALPEEAACVTPLPVTMLFFIVTPGTGPCEQHFSAPCFISPSAY